MQVVSDTAAPWALSVNTAGFNGPVNLTVDAYAGAVKVASATVAVTVDNRLPVNGLNVGTDRASPWTVYWPTGSYRGGATLTVRAYDRAGNVATVTRTVTATD